MGEPRWEERKKWSVEAWHIDGVCTCVRSLVEVQAELQREGHDKNSTSASSLLFRPLGYSAGGRLLGTRLAGDTHAHDTTRQQEPRGA